MMKSDVNLKSIINQATVITNLNKYLDWHNLPIRMNKTGVCNGLATVYAKYALEGKQDNFEKILNQIATMTSDPKSDVEVNEFAKEVALSFMPDDYDKKLTQLHSINTQKINGKKLTPSYNLAMTTSDSNWTKIFNEVGLMEDEVMIVRSVNHAISISKKNGEYIIYDPNYPFGFKQCKSDKAVIEELHFNVFRYTGDLGVLTDFFNVSAELSLIALQQNLYGPLSMQIEVVRHPDKENAARTFPDVTSLYKKYLSINAVAKGWAGKYTMDNMEWAISMNNKEALDALLKKGFKFKGKYLIEAVCEAAARNATEVLPTLLSKITSKKDINKLSQVFAYALAYGRQEALEILLENKQCNICFNTEILQNKNAAAYINLAARGGNVKILENIISQYQNNGRLISLSKQHLNEILRYSPIEKDNAIQAAIASKSIDCVKLLYEQLKKGNPKIGERQLLANLLQAVQSNQPYMVDFFVDEINELPKANKEHLFKSIKLSTKLVERTDISILRKLQFNHVHFSKTAQIAIALKENRPIGARLPIGIMLNKFTDFIKESLLKQDDVKENFNNFKMLKGQLSAFRDSDEKTESIESDLFRAGPGS